LPNGAEQQMTYEDRDKEKPVLHHAAVQLSLALTFALLLVSGRAWDLIARICTMVLDYAGIQNEYVSPLYLIYVRLLDGTVVGFEVLVECSGLISLLVFSFISAFTIGLLRGSLVAKLIWFILSLGAGFLWNLGRLISVIVVAYNFGLPAFSFVHYILAPAVDFVWIVSLWAVGMSWLKREVPP